MNCLGGSMKLEDLIKTVNLFFTKTMGRIEFYNIKGDLKKANVNYDSSISLYDLIKSFYKLYISFKQKYDALEKFDFCKKQDPVSFSELKYYGDFRDLDFIVEVHNPNDYNGYEELDLNLREIDGSNKAYVSNDKPCWGPDYYDKDVDIDNKLIKEYLDLFQEYNFLMELFYRLRECTIYVNGSYSLFSRIKQGSDYVMFGEDIDNFKFIICKNYFDSHDEIIINVKLGEELSINLDDSWISLDGKVIKVNNEMGLDILKKVYINSQYLEDFDIDEREEKGEEKRKILKNNL